MFEILDYKTCPAETVFLGIKKYNFKNTTIIANHDQFVKFDFKKKNLIYLSQFILTTVINPVMLK